MTDLDLLEALRRVPVLRHLPLAELDRMVEPQRSSQSFAPGSVLIEEGTVGEELFVLLDGRVAVRASLSEREDRAIGTRGPGELVGEMALLDDLPRSASVTAEERGARPLRAARRLPRCRRRPRRRVARSGADPLAAPPRERRGGPRGAAREGREPRVDEPPPLAGEPPAARRARRPLRLRAVRRRRAPRPRRCAPPRGAPRRASCRCSLVGETGTGKELVARAIHAASERRERPFVAVNCALFSEALLESELFGHARGAFTGAHAAKPGLVEAADGGTLFLDELADMPRATQAALLRFLELGEFRRLGETHVRRSDARVIAALHVDVDEALESGRVRRDLLLPPRRLPHRDPAAARAPRGRARARRRGSWPTSRSVSGGRPSLLGPGALETLRGHDFPGNVRELRNEIERLYATCGAGAELGAEALSPSARARPTPGPRAATPKRCAPSSCASCEGALARSGGSRSAAARELGAPSLEPDPHDPRAGHRLAARAGRRAAAGRDSGRTREADGAP